METALSCDARPRLFSAGLVVKLLPLWLGLFGAALLLPCLDDGLQLDDHLQRSVFVERGPAAGLRVFEFYSGDPAAQARLLDSGRLPWWVAPGFRHRLVRYVSAATMQLDYALWADRPELMHAHSLLWLCALIAAATWLYRTVLGSHWPAMLAALLYAIDDAHALPTAYLANRNALIATTFGVLAIASYARARQGSFAAGSWLSPICLALGLGAGELAVAAPAYLFAHALCLDRAPLRERVRALLPNALVAVAWFATYTAAGFGARGSGYYDDPLGDPLGFAIKCARHIPSLLLGQWTPIPAELAGSPGMFALAVCTTLVVFALFTPLVIRDRSARFFALGAVLSLVPIAATGPMNRLLFFVGIGCMGLLSLGVQRLVEQCTRRGAPIAGRALGWGLLTIALSIHILLAPLVAWATLDYQARASEAHVRAVASVPHDPQIEQQDLMLLNAPDYPYAAMAIAPMKQQQGHSSARRLRALVANNTALRVTRLDSTSLEVQLDGGLFSDEFSRYFRSAQLRFRPGDRIEIPGMQVHVQRLNAAGDPERLSYRFERPLEHPSLRWLYWRDGQYVTWEPPPIGATVHVPAPGSLFQ